MSNSNEQIIVIPIIIITVIILLSCGGGGRFQILLSENKPQVSKVKVQSLIFYVHHTPLKKKQKKKKNRTFFRLVLFLWTLWNSVFNILNCLLIRQILHMNIFLCVENIVCKHQHAVCVCVCVCVSVCACVCELHFLLHVVTFVFKKSWKRRNSESAESFSMFYFLLLNRKHVIRPRCSKSLKLHLCADFIRMCWNTSQQISLFPADSCLHSKSCWSIMFTDTLLHHIWSLHTSWWTRQTLSCSSTTHAVNKHDVWIHQLLSDTEVIVLFTTSAQNIKSTESSLLN